MESENSLVECDAKIGIPGVMNGQLMRFLKAVITDGNPDDPDLLNVDVRNSDNLKIYTPVVNKRGYVLGCGARVSINRDNLMEYHLERDYNSTDLMIPAAFIPTYGDNSILYYMQKLKSLHRNESYETVSIINGNIKTTSEITSEHMTEIPEEYVAAFDKRAEDFTVISYDTLVLRLKRAISTIKEEIVKDGFKAGKLNQDTVDVCFKAFRNRIDIELTGTITNGDESRSYTAYENIIPAGNIPDSSEIHIEYGKLKPIFIFGKDTVRYTSICLKDSRVYMAFYLGATPARVMAEAEYIILDKKLGGM